MEHERDRETEQQHQMDRERDREIAPQHRIADGRSRSADEGSRSADEGSRSIGGPPAVVAARADEPPVETDEIRALTEAAGYTVVGECTQARPPDPGTRLGSGKVDELATLVAETGAGLVVVDEALTPSQTLAIQERLPPETVVYDRYRLVLAIFGEQARTGRAQLQVELARLQYELPRIREAADEGMLNRRTEKGSPIYDVMDRIDRLEGKLAALPSPAEQARDRRRSDGFDLVTLAGYTNAGKSTLLHRLADDLSLAEADGDHPDETRVAAIADRLFETLETTTRRATIRNRPVLVTDTVGFVQDLPHWLVASFSSTLSEASAADVVVLVADASDPVDAFGEKLETSLRVLDDQGVNRKTVIAALNKVDRLTDDEIERRVGIATEYVDETVPVSAIDGNDLDVLTDAIDERLPTAEATLTLPNGGDAMSLLSWLYDTTDVVSVDYRGETVAITIRGRPAVVEKARGRADSVG